MTDAEHQREIEDSLWDAMPRGFTGMLGLMGGEGGHFQPMTAFAERDESTIWFFTSVARRRCVSN